MDKTMALKHAPHDVGVEQNFLGSLIMDGRLFERIADITKAEQFYDPLHRRIFAAMQADYDEGKLQFSPITLHAAIKSDPGLVEVGGLAYLAGLAESSPAFPAVRDYAFIIAELAVRRELIQLAEDAIDDAHAPPRELPPAAQIEGLEARLQEIAQNLPSSRNARPTPAFVAGNSLLRAIEEQAVKSKPLALSTGLIPLDEIIGGLLPGSLMIVMGRPSMGKSILGLRLARAAAEQGIPPDGENDFSVEVDYYSREMTKDQCVARLLTDIDFDRCEPEKLTPLAYRDLVQMKASPGTLMRAAEANQVLAKIPNLSIIADGFETIEKIGADQRAKKRKTNARRVSVVDHLHLIDSATDFRNTVALYTHITKSAKQTAKDTDGTMIMLCQLSRAIDARDDKRPLMADARESGSIEQDADVMVGLFRAAYYAQQDIRAARNSEQRDKAISEADTTKYDLELGVRKNRDGATGDVTVFIEPKASAIRSFKPHVVADGQLQF